MSSSTFSDHSLSLLRMEGHERRVWSSRQRQVASASDQSSTFPTSYTSSSPFKLAETTAGTKHGVRACDILCGRDKMAHNHPGNKRFRRIVQSYREEYQSAGRRDDKNRITNEIIAWVYREGGRFLRTDEVTGEWIPVEPSGVHDKVSHALRSAKEPRRIHGGDVGCNGEGGSQSKFVQLASMQQLFFMNLLNSDDGDA